MTTKIDLLVRGVRFGGWKEIEVSRAIDTICDSFTFKAVEFGEVGAWPIYEEDPCEVYVDDTRVISGEVDTRIIEISAAARELTFSGRSRAAALVDCSAYPKDWQLRGADVAGFLRKLCDPHGVSIGVASGVTLLKPPTLSVSPGDSVFEVIDRVCKFNGTLPRSLSDGSVAIMKPGGWPRSSESVVQGVNVISGKATFATAERFGQYVCHGSDGETAIRHTEKDPSVRRQHRLTFLQAEGIANLTSAKQRAAWERATRSARSTSFEVTVRGAGFLPGTLVPVDAEAWGLIGDMLAAAVTLTVGPAGTKSKLTLVPPDAFELTPKPASEWKAPPREDWHAVRAPGEF